MTLECCANRTSSFLIPLHRLNLYASQLGIPWLSQLLEQLEKCFHFSYCDILTISLILFLFLKSIFKSAERRTLRICYGRLVKRKNNGMLNHPVVAAMQGNPIHFEKIGI